MATAALEQGTLVRIDGVEHRLYRQITDTLWQLEVAKTGRFVEYEGEKLLRKIGDRTLVFPGNGDVSHCGPANASLSEEALEIAKVRRAYVVKALGVANSKQAIEEVIAEVWEKIKAPKNPPCFTTVYVWKKNFLAAKKDIRALVDRTSAKGNRGDRYPSEVLEYCQEAIAAKYLKRERGSLQETYEDALSRTSTENELRPKGMELPLPTLRLVARCVDKIPQFDKDCARKGREKARKDYRWLKGHVVTEAPLERAHIDHTILDLFVVDDKTRLPLGRPHVTACIDDYSRCVLGMYIGFISPSYQSVAMCLKDCFLPKAGLKDEYPEIKSEWPAYGVMRELVLDNGQDFHSNSLEQVCYSLNINMTYSPRREPWFKGKIERFFGTFNRGVAHGKPGTSFSNIFERDDYDPAKHAVITFSTLKKISRKWIADVYHQKLHSTLHTTPAKMWTSSIRPEDIRFPDDMTQLDAILGRSYQRRLTHKGIEFEGLFYNSSELTELRYQEGPSLDVEIRVDESNIGSIYVVSPKTARTYSVPALDLVYANGISLRQHKIFKKWQARRADKDCNPKGWLQAKKEIQHMVEADLFYKPTKTRKRVARHQEESERGAAKAGKREAPLTFTPHSSGLAVDDSPKEDVHFKLNLRDDMDLTDGVGDFTPIYQEEYDNE